ncbi:hypothetical protein Mapa_009850 [Marchantia paleacea]|nr:hypothetical protein Mapa_009850 [Marchantia paleacea]
MKINSNSQRKHGREGDSDCGASSKPLEKVIQFNTKMRHKRKQSIRLSNLKTLGMKTKATYGSRVCHSSLHQFISGS